MVFKHKDMTRPDISHCRGMSEPTFFAFNVLDKKAGRILAHAVIFSSFEVSDGCANTLFNPTDDPRMRFFADYIFKNCLEHSAGKLKELEKELAARRRDLDELEHKIKYLNSKAQ